MAHNSRPRGDRLPAPRSGKFGALQPQETVLGVLGEYLQPDERVWSGGLVALLGDLQFSAAASRIALNRLVARGLLKSWRQGKRVYYTISPRLGAIHGEGRRQIASVATDHGWNGTWTLVWYSVPERQRLQRARLSRWLSFQGFGALQDGTWIAPGKKDLDIRPLIEQLGLAEHVITFVAQASHAVATRSIVDRAWNLDQLHRMCNLFVSELSSYRRQSARLAGREAFVVRTRVIEMFRQITTADPRLSDGVLGVTSRRRQAIALFQQLQQTLFPAAEAYFRQRAIPAERPASSALRRHARALGHKPMSPA